MEDTLGPKAQVGKHIIIITGSFEACGHAIIIASHLSVIQLHYLSREKHHQVKPQPRVKSGCSECVSILLRPDMSHLAY